MDINTRLTEMDKWIESGDTGWEFKFRYESELENLCVALATNPYVEYRHRGRLLRRVLEYFKAENIDGFWVEIGWNYVNIHIIAAPPGKTLVDHYKAIAAFKGWGPEKLLLKQILETMDIPAARQELTVNNCRWLLRNLGIRNRHHKNFDEAMGLLKEIVKNAR